MANILKQSTGIDVRVGPFVDATDAVSPETGVSLSTADQAELLKANGAATVDISGATWAAVTGADGWYDLTLTTSHTDTVGELVVVVQDASLCLPVHARFQVVEEAIYDALFAASATGFDANGRVDVSQWAGNAVAWTGSAPDVDVRYQYGSATAAAALKNGALGVINGTAVTGTLSTTQATTGLTGYADDELIGRTLVWTGGTAAGQVGVVTDYANTGGLLTFERLHDGAALATAPANNDTFVLV